MKFEKWGEMSQGEMSFGEKCLTYLYLAKKVGRNVFQGETSQGEMSQGEMSFREKRLSTRNAGYSNHYKLKCIKSVGHTVWPVICTDKWPLPLVALSPFKFLTNNQKENTY